MTGNRVSEGKWSALEGVSTFTSSIEIEIEQDQHNKAQVLIVELLAIYNGLTEPDIINRLGHVRTLIAWARISPLSEAEERWSAALQQNKSYNPFEEDVFTCCVIYLFISLARLNLQQIDRGRAAFYRALNIMGKQRPQFLIPGIGTYLFKFVREELQSVWQLNSYTAVVCQGEPNRTVAHETSELVAT